MLKTRMRAIETEVHDYTLIGNQLYKRCADKKLHMCATEPEYISLLEQAHKGMASGHFSVVRTAMIIQTAGIWWPTLSSDAEEYVKRCDECQRTKKPIKKDEMPLRPMMGTRAFAKWRIDFVGPINPPTYRSHAQYILL